MQGPARQAMFRRTWLSLANKSARTLALADLMMANEAIAHICTDLSCDLSGRSELRWDAADLQWDAASQVVSRFRSLTRLTLTGSARATVLRSVGDARLWTSLRTLRIDELHVEGLVLAAILLNADGLDDLYLRRITSDRSRWPTAPFRTKIRALRTAELDWDAAQWRTMAGCGVGEPPLDTIELDYGSGDGVAAAQALAARGRGIGAQRIELTSYTIAPVPRMVDDVLSPLLESVQHRLVSLSIILAGAVGASVFATLPKTISALRLRLCRQVDGQALIAFLEAGKSPALRYIRLDDTSIGSSWSQLTCRRIVQRCRARKITLEHDFEAEPAGW